MSAAWSTRCGVGTTREQSTRKQQIVLLLLKKMQVLNPDIYFYFGI